MLIKRTDLLEHKNKIMAIVQKEGFKGSTEIREAGEHIFGTYFGTDRYQDARLNMSTSDSFVLLQNNGLCEYKFELLKLAFKVYCETK